MLEFPESHTVAGQIAQHLLGRVITRVELEQSPHRFAFYSEYKNEYAALLTGWRICGARAPGGIVELDTENAMMFFSDGARPAITRRSRRKSASCCWSLKEAAALQFACRCMAA